MDKRSESSPIEPPHVSTGRTAAAEHLRHLIEANHFEPGERLPSERELAALLGVGRTTVREAKSTLEALGLIEVRQGSGSYVTGKLPHQTLSSMWSAWYATHHDELVHLLQVREALETKAAVLATANTTPTLITQLHMLVNRMRQAAAEGNMEEVARVDARFHGLIVEASGNTILVELLSSLSAVLADDRVAVFSLTERLERSLNDHAAIVEALEGGDPLAVRAALYKHFESVLQDVTAVVVADGSD